MLTEIYMLLFTDTLVGNFAFGFSSEVAVPSMKLFGIYNPYLVIIVASLGFLAASIINYALGSLCYKILSPENRDETEVMNDKVKSIRESKYLLLFLLLSAVPFFGKFIILFLGFCRTRFLFTILIVAIAKFLYYSVFMLT